eukprot:CAMPEP_0206143578 /NCGR_PEP_ID=MMETSP1473-20131121/21079_1 /ASSEMBLY_ACC=CAM_ASM_001109 /TAXON_ID=1461547 /ORGANISM="Stichococcus sp, Strain RCC1054" /LENGTH=135 /DNA_ID=CAMNT_0053539051 /DNA_START=20 /DNA_END=429 /DNA_ORIENTATION=+
MAPPPQMMIEVLLPVPRPVVTPPPAHPTPYHEQHLTGAGDEADCLPVGGPLQGRHTPFQLPNLLDGMGPAVHEQQVAAAAATHSAPASGTWLRHDTSAPGGNSLLRSMTSGALVTLPCSLVSKVPFDTVNAAPSS